MAKKKTAKQSANKKQVTKTSVDKKNRVVNKNVKATDISMPVVVTQQSTRGTFLDFNCDIEPYSMRHTSPTERIQMLSSTFQTFFMPYLELAIQNGVAIDFDNPLPNLLKRLPRGADAEFLIVRGSVQLVITVSPWEE